MATDPLDDTPPPEELDMAVEEVLGHALPGNPEERIAALKRRIVYLQDQAARCSDHAEASRLARELAEARRQRDEFERQHEGRN